MTGTATQQGPGGLFATSRRGGLTGEEIREIEAHRAKDRPTPWPALAKRYGRCEADIRAIFATAQPKAKPEPVDDEAAALFPWNDAQTSYLIAHYHKHGAAEVAKVLGRTQVAVSRKAHRLGVTNAPASNATGPRSRTSKDIWNIIAEVARKHDVPMPTIMGEARDRAAAWARQEAYAELRARKPDMSTPAIGQVFGRDHTTVIFGIRQFEARQANAVTQADFAAVHSGAGTVPGREGLRSCLVGVEGLI